MQKIIKDVVVVGAGGAGLSAALTAAASGLDVLLVEKTPYYGGTTAWSGGGIWVPCNSLGREAGYADSESDASAYVKAVVGPTLREDLLAEFLRAAPQMVDFMQGQTSTQFALHLGFPDWFQELQGATQAGRLLAPVTFDGRQLGDQLKQLREPLREFNAPAGMMLGFDDMPHIANVKKSWRSLVHVLKLVVRYLRDRLVYGRGTRLTMGNALVGRLLKSCLDAGVELWHSSPMLELMTDDGVVTGVEVERDGEKIQITARRGVILASGGFSANERFRQQFIPFPDQHISMVCEGNNGVAISAALDLGAGFDGANISNAGWLVVSVLERPDGTIRKFPHLFLDRGKPGCIAVNLNGERFGNESTTNLVEPMHRTASVPAFLVADHAFVKKYGLGLVKPRGLGLKKMVEQGYLIRASSLQQLADKTGIASENLLATVERFNSFAERGIDEDFGRGSQQEDFHLGDLNHTPNPCLGPIAQGPFYAVKIYPGDSTTTVGLKVDSRARVLGGDAEPIPGLCAVGLDMNSLWRGKAPSHGGNNTLSLTFGFVAARSLADVAE